MPSPNDTSPISLRGLEPNPEPPSLEKKGVSSLSLQGRDRRERSKALSHLTVLELSDRIAGSFCGKFLADFGAEVIKVEPPVAGEPARRAGPFKQDRADNGSSGLHLFLNTNKRSITLDPSVPTGAIILKELLRPADILIETMRPGALASWGLPFDELERQNPGVVITSITDFGQYGPYRDYKGADLVHWAMGSLLVACGLPDREPVRVGEDVSEYVGGLNAAGATLGVLYGREQTGSQRIDVSVMESLITVLPSTALGASYNKTVAPRGGNRFPISIVQCKDGYVGFYTMLQHQWESMTVLLGRTDLMEDPRFATPMARLQHPNEAMDILRPWFRQQTAEEAVRRGQELRIPIIKVASAADVASNPQFHARGFFTNLGTRASGPVKAPGRPFNLERTPWRLQRPAPELGQDNHEVYCNRLGFSKDELVILSEQGVV